MEKVKRFVLILKDRLSGAEINSVSVMISYYLLLSLFPLLIAVGNILPYFSIDAAVIMDYLATVVPSEVLAILEPVIRSFLDSSSGGLLSLGLLGAIWSSSRGITYLQKGLNKAYGVQETASFIAKKLISIITIVLVLLLLVAFVLVFSFSDMLLSSLNHVLPWAGGLNRLIRSWKWPVTVAFLFCMMVLAYRVTTDVKLRIREVIPGALFAAGSLMGLVQLFSIYLQFYTRSLSSYGTLGTFFLLMFWLNFSVMIVILGAVLNATIREYRFGKAEAEFGAMDNAVEITKRTVMGRLKALGERVKARRAERREQKKK